MKTGSTPNLRRQSARLTAIAGRPAAASMAYRAGWGDPRLLLRTARCNAMKKIRILAQPVFDLEIINAREFALVIGNYCVTERQGVSGYQQVVCADGVAGSLQACP